MPHLQYNIHTNAMDICLLIHPFTSPSPAIIFGIVYRIWIVCDQRKLKLTRELVTTGASLLWCSLLDPASLTVYTTLQQSKRLNQSCDRRRVSYFCHKQSTVTNNTKHFSVCLTKPCGMNELANSPSVSNTDIGKEIFGLHSMKIMSSLFFSLWLHRSAVCTRQSHGRHNARLYFQTALFNIKLGHNATAVHGPAAAQLSVILTLNTIVASICSF